MITPVFNQDAFKILTVLSTSPGSRFQRNELKERTKMNNVNLDNAINMLSHCGLISRVKRLIAFNLDSMDSGSVLALVSKQYKALKGLPFDAFFSLVDLVALLSRYKGLVVFLFGSYSKLVYKDASDIDIAVISDRQTAQQKEEVEKVADKIMKRYGKSIQAHYFGNDFFKNRRDPLVREIFRNGIRLI